jgi:multisubunit Na+/H+ antiporter MnhF subunit
VNGWLLAATVLTGGMGLCVVGCARVSLGAALVAVELAGTIASVVLLAIAAGTSREAFGDLAVAIALLTVSSALIYARYLGRRL